MRGFCPSSILSRIAGHARKCVVHLQNYAARIGDKNAFAGAGEDRGGQPQPFLSLFALSNVLAEDHNAAHRAVVGSPGKNLAPHPQHASIRQLQLALPDLQPLAGKAALVFLPPALWKSGEELVMRMPDDLGIAKGMHLQPSPARGQVAHLAIEHGQRRRSVFDEHLQQLFARGDFHLSPLPIREVFDKEDDAAYHAIGGPPGNHFPPGKSHRSIGPFEAVLLGVRRFARQTAPVRLLKPFGKVGKDLVMVVADNLPSRETVIVQPSPAHGKEMQIAIEHGQGHWGMLDEQAQQFLAFAERSFCLLSSRNVLDGAVHRHWPPLGVAGQFTPAVYPAPLSVARPDDAVFPVERLALAQDLMLEIGAHRLTVTGMNEIQPSADCAHVRGVDAEDLVHDGRARPHPRRDVEGIAAKSRNPLRLPQRFLAFAQSQPRFDVLGDLRRDAEDADDLAARAIDRVFAIVEPSLRPIPVLELLDLIHALPLGKRPAFHSVSGVGQGFRADVVVGLAHHIGGFSGRFRILGHAPARSQDHMIVVLQEDAVAGVLDQGFEAREQMPITGLIHLPRVFKCQFELRRTLARAPFYVSPLAAADASVGMTDAQVDRARSVVAIRRKQGFRQAGILGVDAILQLDLCGEKIFPGVTEQGLNAFAGRDEPERSLQNEAESCIGHCRRTICAGLPSFDAAYHCKSSKSHENRRDYAISENAIAARDTSPVWRSPAQLSGRTQSYRLRRRRRNVS